jgi:transposase
VLSAVLAGAALLLWLCCVAVAAAVTKGAGMPSTFQRHPNPGVVTVGVDTHADVHVAAVIDGLGRLLGSTAIPTTVEGYAELLAWAEGFGQVGCFGVEGTGWWGAGLSRWLAANGQAVVEVPRPDRARRRRKGESDTLDAEAAARAALAGLDVVIPKRQDGPVEMIRALRVARRSAMKARIQAGNQLLGLLTRAPEELRARLWKLRGRNLVKAALRLEPAGGVPASVTAATELALRELAGRWHGLDGEIDRLDELLDALVKKVAPDLLALLALSGVGTETAAALLEAAGDNPGRLVSEAAFAHLCGAAPLPASSGKTTRHRFNPGGHRDANEALWRIVLVRMKSHAPTRAYVARRTAEGLSKREIMRCLKRYVAREVYRYLKPTNGTSE